MNSRYPGSSDPDARPLKELTTTPPITPAEHAAQMRLRVARRRAIEDALEASMQDRHCLDE